MKRDWIFFSFLILLFGTCLLFLVPPAIFFPTRTGKLLVSLFALPILFLAGTILPCVFHTGKNWRKELMLAKPEKADLDPTLMMFLLFLLFAVLSALAKHFGVPMEPQIIVGIARNCEFPLFLALLCSAGILAPISEELVFRRTVFGMLSRCLPEPCAMILTAFLFALMHGLIWQSVELFFFGLILQYHAKKTITRPILMHAAFNWCSLTVLILYRMGLVNLME